MTFKIEFSDLRFRLCIIAPNGEEDYLDAMLYCSVSSVVGPDGKVYGAYLNGSEPDLDTLSSHPTDLTMVSTSIKVYDLSAWPNLKPLDALVTLEETEFDADEEDGDDDGEGEDEEDGENEPADFIEVKPL